MSERIAVVPGSFDPITNGHIDVINRAAKMYDRIYVAVMINPQKQYMFSLEQREAIAKACFCDRENISVISSEGWLWKLAQELNACAIVKGYRNDTDLEYEKEMAKFNEEHYPMAKTVFIKAEECLAELSSTLVRKKITNGESIADLLPCEAISVIKSFQ